MPACLLNLLRLLPARPGETEHTQTIHHSRIQGFYFPKFKKRMLLQIMKLVVCLLHMRIRRVNCHLHRRQTIITVATIKRPTPNGSRPVNLLMTRKICEKPTQANFLGTGDLGGGAKACHCQRNKYPKSAKIARF